MPGGVAAAARRRGLIFGIFVVSALGCDEGGTGVDAGVRTDGGPFATCVIGAWERPRGSGACSCVGSRPSSECDAPDCEAVLVIVLDESGSTWEADFERAESLWTFTVVDTCPPVPTLLAYTWRASPGGQIARVDMFGDATTFDAECTGDSLVVDEWMVFRRASAGFIAAAEGAFTSGECAGRYPP